MQVYVILTRERKNPLLFQSMSEVPLLQKQAFPENHSFKFLKGGFQFKAFPLLQPQFQVPLDSISLHHNTWNHPPSTIYHHHLPSTILPSQVPFETIYRLPSCPCSQLALLFVPFRTSPPLPNFCHLPPSYKFRSALCV